MKKLHRIFFQETSFSDKLLIIHICLIYAVCSSCFIGIAVWFRQPELLCRDHKTLIQSVCNEEFACKNPKVSFHINKLGPKTLAWELALICEHKFIQRLLISTIFFGGFLGCLMNVLIYVPATKRKAALALLCLIMASAKVGTLLLSPNIYFVGLCLGIVSFCAIIINSYCFALINEIFTGEVSKIATVLMTLAWGTFGIIYAGFSFYIDSNWRIIFAAVSLILFFIAVSLLFLENTKGVKQGSSKEPTSLIGFLKDISKSKIDYTNFVIFLVVWVATSLTYNDVLLELESVGQSLYVNMSLIALIEVLASYITGYLILNFNVINCLRNLLSFSFTLYMGFYFSPKSSENPILFVVFLTCKLFAEIIYNLVNIYTPKLIADRFSSYFFIFGRLVSRVMLLFLPHINHLFSYLGIHPFVFLSLIYGVSRYLIKMSREPLVSNAQKPSTKHIAETQYQQIEQTG